ncbi:hypothetical protein Aperf_G00000012705 [Anoplocephala perfoliata]
MDNKQKRKRKAFYRRCAAGDQRAKQRRLEAADGASMDATLLRRLDPGMTGFLLTSNNKEIHQAQIEAYRLLNEAHARLNGPQIEKAKTDEKSDDEEGEDDDADIASALKKELRPESKSNRYIFHGVKTGVSNCGFVMNQSESSSSADLVNDIFQRVLDRGEADTRRILRLQPVLGTCRPDKQDLAALVRKAFKAYWDRSVDSFKDGKPLCSICPNVPLQRAKFIDKPSDGMKRYFMVNFKARNYDKMKKEDAVMTVIATMQEIAPEWSPVTAGADLVINVDVLCNVLCLSFLEKFGDFAKYNIHEAAEASSVNKTPL